MPSTSMIWSATPATTRGARRALWGVAIVLALACAACSSGSGPGSGTPVSSFKVGVTVSGLHGTGLVLRNNGTDDLAVAADGSHQFATSIPAGRHYAVSVRAQPSAPAQGCTVSNGAGTIGSTDVAGIAVNCTTRSFAVGGFVMGLQGTGLVLRNNGGDDLSVDADGSFVFSTAVASGAEYAATVAAAPTAQICQVTSGAQGTVGSGDVTGVTVVCSDQAFHVGGSVSGLLGTGLVLRLNGQDLPIAADGSFTFPTPVVSGGAYDVTVQADPQSPAQGCAVEHASGVIGSAEVSNVAVTCSTHSFRIQGTVTGLKGPGLVLRNSGGDAYAVMGNGTFAFSTAVESGGAYAVTIASQPDRGGLCAVDHGSGAVGNQSVTDVVVRCRGWVGTQLVENNNVGDAVWPQIAFDPSGNAFAVWRQSDGTKYNAWANRYTRAGGWGTAQLIGNGVSDATDITVAVDASGDAVAVWKQGGYVDSVIFANRYTAGTGWGTAQVIGSDANGGCMYPRGAMDAAGNAMAVFVCKTSVPQAYVKAAYYSVGAGWGAAQTIWTGADAQQPLAGFDAAGDAWVAWSSGNGIWAKHYSVSNGWELEGIVASIGANSGLPLLVVDSSGTPMIACKSYTMGSGGRLLTSRYVTGTGWTAPVNADSTSGTGYDVDGIAIQPDSAGNVNVAWYRYNVYSGAPLMVVEYNRFTAGQGWGTAAVVRTLTPGAGSAYAPQVSADPSGNVIVVWRESTISAFGPYDIGSASYAAGQGWGAPTLIESDSGSANAPQIAFDASGRAMAIWNQSDGTRSHIVSNRFE